MNVEPLTLGPTWQRDPDHPSGWLFPKLSLGWALIAWQDGMLQHPSKRPWRYTREQLRWFIHWYALTDDLTFVDREGVLQRLKGWGKDPVGATVCAGEFIGPCRPDPSGRTVKDPWGNEHPAGISHPAAWVQTCAVSKDQTRNTMRLFPSLFTAKAKELYQLDIGKEVIYAFKGERTLEAVTSSPRTLEGARSTFVLKNETEHWIEANEGHEMEDVIERNTVKAPDGSARALAICNAYEPSEDSVAQRTREAYDKAEAGGVGTIGLMYDSVEAPPDAPLTIEDAPAVVAAIRGDSVWLSVPGIVKSIADIRNPPSRSRRWWYNQITAVEDAVWSPQEWDAAAETFEPQPGDIITLGFDGSITDDDSALIASHVERDFLWPLGIWSPPKDGEIDRRKIDRAVRAAFEMYDVVGFYSDVSPWESYVDKWAEDFGDDLLVRAKARHAVGWDMRGRLQEFTRAFEGFTAAIVESSEKATEALRVGAEPGDRLTHDGSRRLRVHALNARRAANKWGFSVRKEHRESDKKIDAVPAATLARQARLDYLSLPRSRRRKTRSGRVWGA